MNESQKTQLVELRKKSNDEFERTRNLSYDQMKAYIHEEVRQGRSLGLTKDEQKELSTLAEIEIREEWHDLTPQKGHTVRQCCFCGTKYQQWDSISYHDKADKPVDLFFCPDCEKKPTIQDESGKWWVQTPTEQAFFADTKFAPYYGKVRLWLANYGEELRFRDDPKPDFNNLDKAELEKLWDSMDDNDERILHVAALDPIVSAIAYFELGKASKDVPEEAIRGIGDEPEDSWNLAVAVRKFILSWLLERVRETEKSEAESKELHNTVEDMVATLKSLRQHYLKEGPVSWNNGHQQFEKQLGHKMTEELTEDQWTEIATRIRSEEQDILRHQLEMITELRKNLEKEIESENQAGAN